MSIYAEMLNEFCHIVMPIDKPLPRESDLKKRITGKHLFQGVVMEDPDCCQVPQITHAPRGENSYCLNCGLCLTTRFLELDYIRLKTGVFFTKKRYYAPITHFKEHLRRYMGARFTEIPQHVIDGTRDVNVENVDAYFLMKTRLKQLKMSKLYKEIFTLIYLHGGHRPCLNNDVYEKCIHDFKVIMQKFLGTREIYQRHSMPCNYMLLDIMLRQNGHVAYYQFPYLKNDKCRDRVLEIYSDLKSKLNNGYN